MKIIATSLLIVLFAGSTWAQSSDTRASMNDLDKTLELCRSLEGFKGSCTEAAKACAAEKTYEDKKACLQKHDK